MLSAAWAAAVEHLWPRLHLTTVPFLLQRKPGVVLLQRKPGVVLLL